MYCIYRNYEILYVHYTNTHPQGFCVYIMVRYAFDSLMLFQYIYPPDDGNSLT